MNGRIVVLLCAIMFAFAARGAEDPGAGMEKTVKDLERRIVQLEDQLRADKEAQAAQETASPTSFNVYWKDGVRFETADKNFWAGFGGRIQNDWAFMTQDDRLRDDVGGFQDGTEFRRSRVYVRGLLYQHVEFKAEYDFAGGDADFKDAYVGLVKLPVIGGIRAGQFKEPFSVEELTSSRFITFLERSLPVEAFAPSRHTGVMLHKSELEGRLFLAGGIFRQADAYGNGQNDDGGGEYDLAARVVGLPVQSEEGDILHIGGAYQYRRPEDDRVRYRSRPEAHLAPRVVDTGWIPADRTHLAGAELAAIVGPVWALAEYMHTFVNGTGGASDYDFNGFSVSAGFFLTGERRGYKKGLFNRTKPANNFLDGQGGLGAWEIAARYSVLDLNDKAVEGGRVDDISIGLNWYLNPYLRVMTNYVYSDVDDSGYANTFQTRFAIDF